MDSLLNFTDLQNRLASDINFTDSNNNDDFDTTTATTTTMTTNSQQIKEDKYSLRPRSMRKITLKQKAQDDLLGDDTTSSRPIRRGQQNKSSKTKSAPLSKYRRKTANARERNRMREINQAFEALRKVIPHMQQHQAPAAAAAASNSNEKLTKITTLRLAMKYINALSSALDMPIIETDDIQMPTDYSDFDCFLLESDGESLSLSDHSGSLLASPPDFPDASLSPVDFDDPSLPALLHSDFVDHGLESTDLSEFFFT